MSRHPAFTKVVLRQRIREAEDADRTIEARFAGLASLHPPENPRRFLRDLADWPIHLYSRGDESDQIRAYSWLLDHVSQLRSVEEARRGWAEAWVLALFELQHPAEIRAKHWSRWFENRPLTDRSRQIYERLETLTGNTLARLCFIRHLIEGEAWSEAIGLAERSLHEVSTASDRRSIYHALITALLSRDEHQREEESGDAVEALNHLFSVEAEGLWTPDFGDLFERAVQRATPEDLRQGRGIPTNILVDAYRGFARVGKEIGKFFGGREALVPYDKGVLRSAPELLVPRRVEQYLRESESLEAAFRRGIRDTRFDAESAAAAATISLASLWRLHQIDPRVLDAMTFAGSGSPESFAELQGLAEEILARQSDLSMLSGYVAEQQVASDLASQGHVVEFAAAPNNPGWDLLVDGHQVQVKNSLDPDYVLEHFDRYPDIPVIVNSELAESLSDHPMVWVDSNLHHAEVNAEAQKTLESLDGFGDAAELLPIPLISLVFAAARNFGDMQSGRIDELGFATRVGIDAGARTVGGGTGAVVGGVLGTATLGPVGTIVGGGLGAWLGSLSGSTGADALNRPAACSARHEFVQCLGDFGSWFCAELLSPRFAALQERHQAVHQWAEATELRRSTPESVAVFYVASREMLRRAEALLDWFDRHSGDSDAAKAHRGWVALRECRSFFHPALKTRLGAVEDSRQAYLTAVDNGIAGASAPAS